ncbi:MAG: thiamine pyrophosphate-dependent enzyme, partial [Acidimicrobiia bacterium]
MQRVLAPDGSVVGELPDLANKELKELYELMVRSRDFDRRALAAQRVGRIGTYPMLEGQEAAQVGSAFALAADDFV